ncbi:MAG: hypothetical protein P8X69_12145 [Maritimibacter sp.]
MAQPVGLHLRRRFLSLQALLPVLGRESHGGRPGKYLSHAARLVQQWMPRPHIIAISRQPQRNEIHLDLIRQVGNAVADE